MQFSLRQIRWKQVEKENKKYAREKTICDQCLALNNFANNEHVFRFCFDCIPKEEHRLPWVVFDFLYYSLCLQRTICAFDISNQTKIKSGCKVSYHIYEYFSLAVPCHLNLSCSYEQKKNAGSFRPMFQMKWIDAL